MPARTSDDDELTETRERLSAALGGSDALLHTLDLHSKVSVTDSTGRIIDVNDAFCRGFGYTRDELLGEFHSVLRSGVHDAAFWAAMWRTIIAGHPWRGEICNRAKDGALHWADAMIAPIMGTDGLPALYISIRTDITAAKQTELKLRASEAFLDRTGQTAKVGGWEFDVATQELRWSAQMMRIHEVALDYVPQLGAGLAFYPPRARAKVVKVLREATRAGRGWDLEVPMTTARGRPIWVRTVCEAEFVDGRPARLVGSMQDITARKGIETSLAQERARMVSLLAQLQEANARFAIASESAGIAIWDYDVAAQTLVWDDRMYGIYGLERSAEPPKFAQWENALHPEDRARCVGDVERALRGEADLDTEFRIIQPGGDIRHVKATARVLRGADGVAQRLTGVNIDVTASKRAEVQLFKTSSMLRTVLDSAAEISIIATDPDLIIKVFNAGAERLLGYDSDTVVGHTSPTLMHDADELRALCAEVGAEQGRALDGWEVFVQPPMLNRSHECTFVRADGKHLKVSQVVTAMHTYEGELLGYLSVGHDVTKQKQYEQSLREATQRAENANLAKSAFLANMSHEIRTPMNAVIGLSYLLGRTALDERQSAFLGNIQTASKSLLAIINDVLDLSKIEAGELMVERTAFCPHDLLHEVVDVMRLHADAKGIEFIVEIPNDLPALLEGDPTRLKQILTNLLSNAIRFTDRGGVELRVVREADSGAGVPLCFFVKDTGIGISPDSQSRLFAPFAQADASITRRYGGTGLGLSIVKSLVKVLGGTVGLESAPGVGSEFTVRLTFNFGAPDAQTLKTAEMTLPGPQGLPGVRVLVVDDSDMNLDVVKYILELEGARVALARNGQEALDRLQTDAHEFDLVLMDVQMPVLGGHDATRSIRSALGLVDLPVIGLTAGALSSERDRAIAAGMDDFLIKPFEAATLVKCIRRHLRDSSARAATPIAAEAVPAEASLEWPEIDGIDGPDARARLSHDLGLFLSSLARVLVEFSDPSIPQDAAEEGALTRQAARMHKLKGNAGMLGARTIHTLAAEAEAACVAGAAGKAADLTAALAVHLQRLRESAAPVINAARAGAAAIGSADAEFVPHLVGELVDLLRHQNLSALDRYRTLAPQLRGALGAVSSEALRGYMEALQFDVAADLLEDCVKRLAA